MRAPQLPRQKPVADSRPETRYSVQPPMTLAIRAGSLMPAFCQQSLAIRASRGAPEVLRQPPVGCGSLRPSRESSSSWRGSRGPSEFERSTTIDRAIPAQRGPNPSSRSDFDRQNHLRGGAIPISGSGGLLPSRNNQRHSITESIPAGTPNGAAEQRRQPE